MDEVGGIRWIRSANLFESEEEMHMDNHGLEVEIHMDMIMDQGRSYGYDHGSGGRNDPIVMEVDRNRSIGMEVDQENPL